MAIPLTMSGTFSTTARLEKSWEFNQTASTGLMARSTRRFQAARVAALASAFCAAGVLAVSGVQGSGINVTTYHYDNYRTGWNAGEMSLTPDTVQGIGTNGKTFQMTNFVAVDQQVDAQPLVMTNQTIAGQGTHNVVYVATENNSIYAIDADSGAILLHQNFGPAVPIAALPGKCRNNSSVVGINSTPVIDVASSTMYVIVYNYAGLKTPTYYLHALDLSSLTDLMTPVVVTASGKLSNGSTYAFNPSVSRQRVALLLANGNVYAGFGSFCDLDASATRGWVLGWDSGTLKPLASNELDNTLATDPNAYFLSSVWMSGYGIASGGPHGDIYFVTGNTDYSGTVTDGVDNIAESVVQMSSDLSTVETMFTPSDASQLDEHDIDFGAGGALLIPPQTGQASNLLVAAGKNGVMYLLNSNNLDNYTTGPGRILGQYQIGGCWCGQSYFRGPDNVGRVVTSGGSTAGVWMYQAGPPVALVKSFSTSAIAGHQDPGFFTSVSSRGITNNTGVIWAVGRADGSANEYISLNAFAAQTGATLYTANAGTWPNKAANANLVPVVANGKVYVGSYKGLAIFGLSSATSSAKVPVAAYVPAVAPLAPGQHEIYGNVQAIKGSTFVMQKRDGALVTVEALSAAQKSDLVPPAVGHGVDVQGIFNTAGVLVASLVVHAKDHPSMWLPDR
jgi:hypothetical protein